ncbi:unnamed protein product, partial [Rotaria magnacalcarata]
AIKFWYFLSQSGTFSHGLSGTPNEVNDELSKKPRRLYFVL